MSVHVPCFGEQDPSSASPSVGIGGILTGFSLCHSSCWGHSVCTGVLSGSPGLYLTAGRSTPTLRCGNQTHLYTSPNFLSRENQPCLRICSQGKEKEMRTGSFIRSLSTRKLLASSGSGAFGQEGRPGMEGRPRTQKPPASKLHALSQEQKCEHKQLR